MIVRNKTWIAILAVAVLLGPTASSAQQLFDFDGQANLPTSVGGTLSMVAVVLDGSPALETPLPLDFANFEYTIVVDGVILDSESGGDQFYSGGTITLYEDDATPADYANPATFSDGTALLSGSFTVLNRTTLLSLVQANGSVDWTGGSRIGDLAPADRTDWGFFVSVSAAEAMAGYDENWDGKVAPREPVVSTELQSFGGLKAAW